MQVSRSHGVGSRAGGFFAVALAILGLGFLLLPPKSNPSPSLPARGVGQAALHATVDPETGLLTVGPAPVAKALDAELQSMLSRSTQGLRPVRYPHGAVGVNLQGRFQSATVAHVDAAGHLHTSCLEDASRAEVFLGRRPVVTPPLEVK
jgi:hypothetical protein